MRRSLIPTLLLSLMCALAMLAQAPERLYVVTHVDLMAPFADAGGKLVAQQAAASRKDTGSVRYEVLIEPERKNHLTLVSVWQSREAFEKHSATAHTRQFREKLQPMLGGPLDERLHFLLP